MPSRPELDAIIIADSGIESLSGTNPLKLHIEGRVGAVQVIADYIKNHGKLSDPIPDDNQFTWASAPKLNGIYLTSYLNSRALSTELIHNYIEEKERFIELLDRKPKAVIISSTFIFFKKTLRKLAENIRLIAPDIYIIAGGSFVYYSYLLLERTGEDTYETAAAADDFLFLRVDDEPAIDLYIVSPRGEATLKTVLNDLTEGTSPNSVANTAYLKDNKYFFNARVDDVANAEPVFIDWETMPPSLFQSGVLPLQASNGCPYKCSFCNFTRDRRLTYVKPVQQLISEILTVEKHGIRYIWFVDDNFRLGRNDLNDVCRQFINNGITVKWMCFIRASTLKDADMELLRQAGCIEVQIGLESGDAGILENMHKQADPVMYHEVISRVLQSGINVSCYFIAGFPGETDASAAVTRNFIRSIENPDALGSLSWSIYPFMLTPLSPIYEPEMRRKYDLKGYLTNWSHATMDFQQAKKLAVRAFLEMEKSGPIYREDNLEILKKMPEQTRKLFFNARHRLSKKALRNPVEPADIIETFMEFMLQT